MTRKYNKPLLVAVVVLAAFACMLNQTVLAVATPTIMNKFNIDATTVQWLSTGYSLISGILIPVTAWFADNLNTKKLYNVSLGLFLLGTVIAAFSNSFALLLIARMTQAVGAGIISSLAMMILFSVFPKKEERGLPTALMGVVFGLAPAIGPTLGGWLLDSFGWHSIFSVQAVILAIVFVMALGFMSDVIAHKKTPLDLLSVIFSSVGLGALLFGFSEIGTYDWNNIRVYGSIILGVLITAAFIIRQLRLEQPMLQVRVFANKNFSIAAGISAIAQISMVAVEFILPLYLQNIRGLSAVQSGLTLLPGALVLFLLAPISGSLVSKGKGKIGVVLGAVIMALATLILTRLAVDTAVWHVIAIYALRNVGLAFVMMPVGTLGMNSLSNQYISHGSSANNIARQVGAAMGTAILISVMQKTITANQPTNALLRTNPAAFKQAMYNAFIIGTHAALFVAFGIGALGFLLAFLLKKDKIKKEELEVTGKPATETNI